MLQHVPRGVSYDEYTLKLNFYGETPGTMKGNLKTD